MTGAADPADEAGGEVVYSSDGLSPEITKPPAIAQAAESTDKESFVLDSDDIQASDAFEVFSGKIYSVKTPQSYAHGHKETPLERLARLQTETSQLETELRTTAANSGRAFDEEIVKLATQLKSRLNAAASARLPEQDELTRLIRKQLKQAQQHQVDEATSTHAASSTSSTTSATGLVYELYGTAQNPTTSTEERLTKMERLVGSSATSHKSLLARLEELETMLARVDDKALEQAQLKAKVIRADLEAASKARNKLTATYKKEDSKTIQELHQQMTDLEGLSQHLPALTARLQQMATLHVQSASFATRLLQTEEQAAQAASSLAQLERTLEKVQSHMVENVQTVENNMKQLDDRLRHL
jgi:hypothetical protein